MVCLYVWKLLLIICWLFLEIYRVCEGNCFVFLWNKLLFVVSKVFCWDWNGDSVSVLLFEFIVVKWSRWLK